MPQTLYITEKTKAPTIPIVLMYEKQYEGWVKKQPAFVGGWLESNGFKSKAGAHIIVPNVKGEIERVLAIVDDPLNIWAIAGLAAKLPAKTYHIETKLSPTQATELSLGWNLATYKFSAYKKNTAAYATLLVPMGTDYDYVSRMSASIFWARDLINTPAADMNPQALAEIAVEWGQNTGAKIKLLQGEQLLKANFPAIYHVGKAAEKPAHLVDLLFAKKGAPKITLVGKGVTFDSGGLDIKSSANMKLMKKDMGGAANVLALARMIVESNIPVQLRVLLPIVENAVSGNAMRPLDVITTRKGITVEVGNTDAEGRLILCDTLAEADSDSPDLLIDCATLTGAARVALGTDIPAFFTHDNQLARDLEKHSARETDPLWRLPLWQGYRSMLDSNVADISNDPESGMGGAITAALYLNEFVSRTTSWLHIDMMAWNTKARAGRPVGGEVMGVRALFALIKERYGL